MGGHGTEGDGRISRESRTMGRKERERRTTENESQRRRARGRCSCGGCVHVCASRACVRATFLSRSLSPTSLSHSVSRCQASLLQQAITQRELENGAKENDAVRCPSLAPAADGERGQPYCEWSVSARESSRKSSPSRRPLVILNGRRAKESRLASASREEKQGLPAYREGDRRRRQSTREERCVRARAFSSRAAAAKRTMKRAIDDQQTAPSLPSLLRLPSLLAPPVLLLLMLLLPR